MNTTLPLVYFGNIAWWQMALKNESVGLANRQTYERQTFRNRMQIMGPNTIQILSVPIIKAPKNTNLNEAKITYAEPWPQLHVRSLQAAYGKSPYYMYYMPYIEQVIMGKYSTLAELNLASIESINKLLKAKLVFDLGKHQPDLPDSAFEKSGLIHYNQVFEYKHGFVSNLSILDLLFNLGPDALLKLKVRD